ncbi:MAG: molybdopterin molybdotransferase MoeA [Novosphingobium sp.]|nr:molybdopterin molybdotransferase MoeA [Novosphingobium sp.]
MKPAPLSLEEAQSRLLSLAVPLPVERVDAESALGRYLAAPLAARRTQPSADLSAMDGYAVRADDLNGPWTLAGESAAGHPFTGTLTPGHAVRISTGALLPADAQAIILQEDIKRRNDSIELSGDPPNPADKHIRRAGLDFHEGQQVLAAGERIGPPQIALALSAGHRLLPVRRKPAVAIIDSGDELAADCENCPPNQIPASNGAMLAAMASAVPCRTERLGPVPDTMAALAGAFDAARHADLVVTTGGASVGDHDLVIPAIEAAGGKIAFWRIAIKPGKPLLVATRHRERGRQVIVGLPGNPVSSYVTAFLFVLPLLRAMLGAGSPLPRRFEGRLAAPLKASGSRREFLRGHWNGLLVAPQTVQDSSALAALAASNVLIDRLPGLPPAEPGDVVHAYLLENGGIA